MNVGTHFISPVFLSSISVLLCASSVPMTFGGTRMAGMSRKVTRGFSAATNTSD
ncbi:hypothetical protein D9M68_752240 [compost metagenome]